MADRQAAKDPQASESGLSFIASYLTLAAVWLFAITYVFQNFFIPSSSMASTLLVGDHVLVERAMLAPATKSASFLPYREVKRGDIIVFYKPLEEHGDHMPLVKRVIAIPGDHIHLRNGVVYLNGVAQSEPYVTPSPSGNNFSNYVDDFPSMNPINQPGVTAEWSVSLPEYLQGDDLVVPPGRYFAMGDNRDNSLDSRYWGFVPRENIIGRPLLVYWSIAIPEVGDGEIPLTERAQSTAHEFLHFFSDTRWSRTFHRIE